MGKIRLKDLKEADSVYCSSLEENLAFRKVLVKEGFTWNGGRSYSDLDYNPSGIANTVSYFVKNGTCSVHTKRNLYNPGIIYEASQFLNNNNLYELWD